MSKDNIKNDNLKFFKNINFVIYPKNNISQTLDKK